MSPSPIVERDAVTPEIFQNEILPAGQPVVMRGLVARWPLVKAGKESPEALCRYLRAFDRGNQVSTASGPPSINGRLFYNEDMSALNFRMGRAPLSASLDFLLDHADDERPAAHAVQSVPMRENLPGFINENAMPLISPSIEPRVWIGNNVTIAAHHDPSENIACVAAGTRKFTLFPPEQIANLYMGPFELTPAGATVSMVDFDDPDLERFPNFPKALDAAQTAELEPGDAIYIPYLWWHHVRSLARINVLINYWWNENPSQLDVPRNALLHAMLAIKGLPENHRLAWKQLFDHYIFQVNGAPGEHLPENRRGIIGDLDPEQVKQVRAALAKVLI